ncbi:cytochrome P450 [Trametes coccinea BRFM310]|uniref:Cytochrome P450 n=1 Tax=Trametes coccinea (strain BRFM310) TaxID=1353009 RepID=A0A1Y2IJH5_TRAC3|nr:cytochrome P450 [Trametes coccinea BRFM310]
MSSSQSVLMPRIGSYTVGVTDVLIVAFAFVAFSILRNRARGKLPPGPPGVPLLGNLFDFPAEFAPDAYLAMSKKYGDVFSLHVLGQTFVVLNSATAAIDILEKRSSNYSDRPPSILIEMTGWNWALVLKRYGERWRRVRREIWQHFHPNALGQHRAAQITECRRFLRRLLKDYGTVDLPNQTMQLFSATNLTIVHGLPYKDMSQKFINDLVASEEGFAEVFGPSTFIVELFPWLRHLPAWVPGMGWRNKVAEWTDESTALLDGPWIAAKNALARGEIRPSILTELMDRASQLEGEEAKTEELIVKEITSSIYGAGTDTGAATLYSFFCAMLIYPEVQKRAQAELDAVIGPDRLPEYSDRASLPYINAVVKEVLRWHNVSPLGASHCAMEEDEYRGWRIPKGSIVTANIWGILHDPDVYPEPHVFRPERYWKDGKVVTDGLDPATVVFGFGRRICPGRYFGEDSLFINISSILQVYDILPALDKSGKPIPVVAKKTSGALSLLEPFEYRIKPRSEAALALIPDDF